jgi:hypothetical protein
MGIVSAQEAHASTRFFRILQEREASVREGERRIRAAKYARGLRRKVARAIVKALRVGWYVTRFEVPLTPFWGHDYAIPQMAFGIVIAELEEQGYVVEKEGTRTYRISWSTVPPPWQP